MNLESDDVLLLWEDEEFLKQIDEKKDYEFAVSLQKQYNDELKENTSVNLKAFSLEKSKPISIVDEQWELIDPHPDIHALFLDYDNTYFFGKLKSVEVKWSPRMTLCAGVCSYEGRARYCSIRLSEPLLKFRPRKDLVETLLHEMIHAYLFVTHNIKDREGHGPEFLSHMNRINKIAGTKISVYHNFHDEVDLYRQHWWRCDGPCQNRQPFYGYIKRAMNRAPGPYDKWWSVHQTSCGGKFIKIKEPDNYNKKKAAKRKSPSASESKGFDIRSFLNNSAGDNTANSNPCAKSLNIFDLKSVSSKKENVSTVNHLKTKKDNFMPFQDVGVQLGTSSVVPSHKDSILVKRDWDLCAVPSTSSEIVTSKPLKIPQLLFARSTEKVPKGQSTTIPSAVLPKNLIQSPIESFLIPRTGHADKENENLPDVCKKNCTPRMFCPICHLKLFTMHDIEFHMNKCLIIS